MTIGLNPLPSNFGSLDVTPAALASGAEPLLRHALCAIARQLCATSADAGLWLSDGGSAPPRLLLAMDAGRVLPPSDSWLARLPAVDALAAEQRFSSTAGEGQPSVLSLAEVPIEAAQVLRQRGVQAVVVLPMSLPRQPMGLFLVFIPEGQPAPTRDRLAPCQALAHQAALARHLATLAAESRRIAILDERARLAREVHDGIAQSFIGIQMALRQLQAKPPAPTPTPAPAPAPALDRVLDLAEQGLAEARRIVRTLRPWPLDGKPFIKAVTGMARAIAGDAVRVRVTSVGTWQGLGADDESQLFRIVQEAVNNAARHAGARELAIEFSASGADMSVLVIDDGRGFDVKATQDAGHGFGLVSMRQRAERIGAVLSIVSTIGEGTQVFASLRREPPAP